MILDGMDESLELVAGFQIGELLGVIASWKLRGTVSREFISLSIVLFVSKSCIEIELILMVTNLT